MIDQAKHQEDRPKFSARLLLVSILFFIPSAILIYSTVFLQNGFFVSSQIGGYVFFIGFAFVYIGIIKAIAWILSRMGIKLR